ncbi:hypothetical protein JL720_16062 [Aureococcus anophagefferens]|nr:hypothetical protein JL720_16062 [Aureococcus anophagefferens]
MALGAALVEPLVWYAYYWVALFVLEERLWRIVSAAPLRVLRRSWFATWASAPLTPSLALLVQRCGAAATLRSACLADRGCRGRLRSDAWGLYDDNDAQWRKFRSRCRSWRRPRRGGRQRLAFGAARFLGGLAFVAAAHGSHAPFVLAWCAAFHGAARGGSRRPRSGRSRCSALACKERAWPLRRRMTWAYVASAPRLDAHGGLAPLADALPFLAAPRLVRARRPRAAPGDVPRPCGGAGLYLEAALRRTHVYALAASGAYGALPPGAAAAFAFLFINVLWLKFAFLWRCFGAGLWRAASPPENMRRFVCDNFTIAGFWRGWHASFNGWLRASSDGAACVPRRRPPSPSASSPSGTTRRRGSRSGARRTSASSPSSARWASAAAPSSPGRRARRGRRRAAGSILALIAGNVAGYALGAGGVARLAGAVAARDVARARRSSPPAFVFSAGAMAALAVRRLERPTPRRAATTPRASGPGAQPRKGRASLT